jgi:hypothetical protein
MIQTKKKPRLPPHDPINAPSHYRAGTSYESIRVIEEWRLGFHLGNTIKYICRWETKGGLADLKKARWYLTRFIETEEAKAKTKKPRRKKGKKPRRKKGT